jgi:hypothetical protein
MLYPAVGGGQRYGDLAGGVEMAGKRSATVSALSNKALQEYVLTQIREKRERGEQLNAQEQELETMLARRRAKFVPLNKRIVQQIREPATDQVREARDGLLSSLNVFLRSIAPEARNGARVLLRGKITRRSTSAGDFEFAPSLTEATRNRKREAGGVE